MKKIVCLVTLLCFILGGLLAPLGPSEVYASTTVTPQIAGGGYFSLALKTDGTVWAWGKNDYGQLGDGTTTNRSTPAQITGLSDIIAISADNFHSLALKDDGTVWAWGKNDYGQLGDGTTSDSYTPVQVAGLSGVTAITLGNYFNLALKSDGTVWAWGKNNAGQLGNGTTSDSYTPVQVAGLSGVTGIGAGDWHSLAVKGDGTAWAWGSNGNGILGDGTVVQRNTPVQVIGLNGVIAVEGNICSSISLKNDGTVWTWGSNHNGALGDGTTINRHTPVQVIGLTDIVSISGCGSGFNTALKNNGTVFAWGYNVEGELGNGTTTNSCTPVQVSGLSGVTTIAAATYLHTLALKDDGTVWAWGRGNYGGLGNGTTTDSSIPVQVIGLNLLYSPDSPENLTATSGNAQVDLTWTAVTGSTGYNVKRATTPGGPYTTIASNISELTYDDTGLTNGITYYYAVSATDTTGESANSNEASATPQAPAPGVPANLTATAGDSQVALTWTAVTGTSGYNVKRATTPGGPYTTVANNVTETTYTDTGLTNGITYYYAVSATNGAGESPDSNEASATPQGIAQSNRAILVLTMTDGSEREYDLPMDDVTDFLQWYDARSNGGGRSYFALSKAFISGPFSNRKDYVLFDKIFSFEVMEYSK